MVKVTKELLDAGKSARGGWTAAQLRIIGIAWPPKSGWVPSVIGKEISKEDADRFIAARKT